MRFLLLFLAILNSSSWLTAQATDPLPVVCGGASSGSEPESEFQPSCSNTSPLKTQNTPHIPHIDARSIRVNANFIILQKINGTGNFQDITEHRAFLDDWFNACNERFSNLWGSSDCSPLMRDAKVQIVPNWIFLPDPDQGEYNWNNDNNSGGNECPTETNWWLEDLDESISTNPNIPKGINVYLTVDGSIYNQMVVAGTINDPEAAGMNYVWCSEWPDQSDLTAKSRISIANLYLKYWWFQNHPNVVGQPFSTTRQWLVNEGVVLAHEFGHSFIRCYNHDNTCTNHLMNDSNQGGNRSVLRPDDVGCLHRNLAISNLRQFIDCDESYNPSNTPFTTTTFDRIVATNQIWDHNMRQYSNITVRTGATLTLKCKLLMPYNGVIKVERGAKLIIDGGEVYRANTCLPTEFWRGVAVAGNSAKAQPSASATLANDDAGVVILINSGKIEGAVVGVTTQRIPGLYEPQYWGGLVDANDFTFEDCRKGVEFMQYNYVNNSKFTKTRFLRTSSGSSYAGVTIWDTDGLLFEECTFNNMVDNGIRSWDAVFTVNKKNKFGGSDYGILAGATMLLLQGQITVGQLGQSGTDRNLFKNNVHGIVSTANANVEIFSNDFENSNFDVIVDGYAQSALIQNNFVGSGVGNEFKNTAGLPNTTLCNYYSGNVVGTSIKGNNPGFLFRQEDFNTLTHDLYLVNNGSVKGEIQFMQGSNGAARWNYFTANKPENIKANSAIQTETFRYFHPNPSIDARLKPKCALNDDPCIPESNFEVYSATGPSFSNCMFPDPNEETPCETEPCYSALKQTIAEKQALYHQNPSMELKAELQTLVSQREKAVTAILSAYLENNDWSSVEDLLNNDLNGFNRRRLVSAKMMQRQFGAAQNLLQNFPIGGIDDQYFVDVQTINLARLSDSTFVLTPAQDAQLTAIAEAPSPESGYAQSLLGLLTGRVFTPELPDVVTERQQQATAPNSDSWLEIAPNPADEQLRVSLLKMQYNQERLVLELRDLGTGRLVYAMEMPEVNVGILPVKQLPGGLYVLTLRNDHTILEVKKVLVQH